MKYPLMITACAVLLLSACSKEESATNPTTNAPATSTSAEPAKTASAQPVNNAAEALEFELTDLDGNAVKASDYRGKWLVLNYWATWCAPCRDEMPELVKFQAQNADVQVLGIAYEDATVEKLKAFAQDFGVNYPLLTIDAYNPPEFAKEGGLALPTTIVYNAEGVKHDKHMGPIDYAGLMAMVNKSAE